MVRRLRKRRRRITAAAGRIPGELLISEILVRLPASSIARCRCVCRCWRAELASAAFVRRHRELSRARPPSVLAIPREITHPHHDGGCATTTTSGEISFHRVLLPPPPGKKKKKSPPPAACGAGTAETELIFAKAWPNAADYGSGIARAAAAVLSPAHCDGLVAIATATDTVYVCNPATRELVALPPGTHNAELDHRRPDADPDSDEPPRVPPVALGFDRWRNSYVVARYFYRVYGEVSHDEATGEDLVEYAMEHEVFTLGGGGGAGAGEWELTQGPPCIVGPQAVQGPACTRRGIYWHSDLPEPRLMRFGLQHRTFDVVPRPPTGWNSLDDMAELNGKLCYVHVAATDAGAPAAISFHVWMGDDGGGGDGTDTTAGELRWSRLYHLEILDPVPDIREYPFMPVVVADGDAVVAVLAKMLCRFHTQPPQNGSEEEEALDLLHLHIQRPCERDSMIYTVVPYIESLVSIQARNY